MKYFLDAIEGTNIALGGGNKVRDGWTNWDKFVESADIKHDLNVYPYPIKDNSVAQFEAINILEHLDDWSAALLECHRMLKKGGKILIQVPHYQGVYAWSHWDHKTAFNLFTFEPFTENYTRLFIQEDSNDGNLEGVRRFSKIQRRILFVRGKWFWGYAFEWLFNISTRMQLFFELWLSGIFKPAGVMVVLTK